MFTTPQTIFLTVSFPHFPFFFFACSKRVFKKTSGNGQVWLNSADDLLFCQFLNILPQMHLEFSYYIICSIIYSYYILTIHVCNALFVFQLTLYLGKRDYVDHVDSVDAVGEKLSAFIIETQKTGNIQHLNWNCFLLLNRGCTENRSCRAWRQKRYCQYQCASIK